MPQQVGDSTASPPYGLLLGIRAWPSEPRRYTVPPAPGLCVLAVYVNGRRLSKIMWQSNGPHGFILVEAPESAVVTADLDYGPADPSSNAGNRQS